MLRACIFHFIFVCFFRCLSLSVATTELNLIIHCDIICFTTEIFGHLDLNIHRFTCVYPWDFMLILPAFAFSLTHLPCFNLDVVGGFIWSPLLQYWWQLFALFSCGRLMPFNTPPSGLHCTFNWYLIMLSLQLYIGTGLVFWLINYCVWYVREHGHVCAMGHVEVREELSGVGSLFTRCALGTDSDC